MPATSITQEQQNDELTPELAEKFQKLVRRIRSSHNGRLVICQKCGKRGFLSKRWVRTDSDYFAWVSSDAQPIDDYLEDKESNMKISPDFEQFARRFMASVRVFEKKEVYFDIEKDEDVYRYDCVHDPRSKDPQSVNPHYIRVKRGNSKSILAGRKRIYQILGRRRKELRWYVGHYDSRKYHEKMLEYRLGKLKHRPNGRTWCLQKKDKSRISYG